MGCLKLSSLVCWELKRFCVFTTIPGKKIKNEGLYSFYSPENVPLSGLKADKVGLIPTNENFVFSDDCIRC